MRKFSLLILACAVLCISNFSCLKSSTPSIFTCNSIDQDGSLILSYLQTNQITGYTKDASGLYYKIQAQGSGPVPTLSSKAYVTYSGRFTDHTLFDTLADASKSGWVLGTLIKGWQIGLPLIQKSGKISLYVPNQLGYGCGNTGSIPGGSILIFDVTLVDVQ